MKFGSIGTTGALGGSGIAARAWARYVGGNPLLVPYAGGNGTVRDLVAGRLDAAFVALPLALGYIRHEKLRALALSANQRFERLPDVPTLVESGVPIGVEGWFAVFRSGRLPGAVAARAQAAIRAYRMEDASRSDLLSRGLVPSSSTPAQLAHRIRLELVAGLAAQPDPASRD